MVFYEILHFLFAYQKSKMTKFIIRPNGKNVLKLFFSDATQSLESKHYQGFQYLSSVPVLHNLQAVPFFKF
jgi:hypothetical protein